MPADADGHVVLQLVVDEPVEEVAAVDVDRPGQVGAAVVGHFGEDAFDVDAGAIVRFPVAVEPHAREHDVVHRVFEPEHAGAGDVLAHADFVVVAQARLAADVERAVLAAVADRHQLPAVAEAVAVVVGILEVAEVVVVEDALVRESCRD